MDKKPQSMLEFLAEIDPSLLPVGAVVQTSSNQLVGFPVDQLQAAPTELVAYLMALEGARGLLEIPVKALKPAQIKALAELVQLYELVGTSSQAAQAAQTSSQAAQTSSQAAQRRREVGAKASATYKARVSPERRHEIAMIGARASAAKRRKKDALDLRCLVRGEPQPSKPPRDDQRLS